MFKMFKKSFWIVCEDITVSPSILNIHSEISNYCKNSGFSYDFIGDDEVVIEGVLHEICCARSAFYRGRYVIKCREK